MRSLFSGIFRDSLNSSVQLCRARRVNRSSRVGADLPKETIDEEVRSDPKKEEELRKQREYILVREQEKERLSKQYTEQLSRVEKRVANEKEQPSTKQVIQESKKRYTNPNIFATKNSKDPMDSLGAKYYTEREITQMIKKQSNPEMLFRLYNGHKFTYSSKNLVHTLTHYANLVKKEKKLKLKRDDRRFQTLLFTLSSYTKQLSNKEKTLVLWSLCKLGIHEDLNEKLIQELVEAKQLLEFKDISIILWVMGKQNIKKVQVINDLSLELCLRLEDPYVRVIKAEESEGQKITPKKTEEEMEFEDLEELLELPEFKENIVHPQSLSLILWSLGKLGIQDQDLLNASLQVITNNINEFSPLMITNILYAFSSIKFHQTNVIQS